MAARPNRRSKPERSVGATIRTVLITVLAIVPLLGLANLATAAALISAVDYLAQNIRGTVVQGYLTETVVHVVHSRKGPDEHACFGWFSSADGSIEGHRVRVWVDRHRCDDAEGASARLLPGAAAPISAFIADDPEPSLSDPMPFDGLFGTTDGALVGDTGAFVVGLWPYLFLVPVAVIGDLSVVAVLRGWFQRVKPSPRRP